MIELRNYLLAFILYYVLRVDINASLELIPSREVTHRYVNETYRVTCRAKENKNLTWIKPNGDVVTEKIGRIRVQKTPSGVQLILEYIREDIEGEYKCISRDDGQEGSFSLEVAEPVVFTSPKYFEAMLNEDVFLECKVNQKFLPLHQWEFNGNIVPTDDRYEFKNEGMLIHNVELENAGRYYCIIAHNPFQSNENRRAITLTVYTKPILERGDKAETVVYSFINEVTSLQCNVTAVPPAYFIWYDKSKTALNPKNDNVTITNGENTSILGITVSQEERVLICEACNELGCLNQTIVLRNTTKLKQPNIYKWESASDSVDFFISFQPEATYYVFQYYFDVYDWEWEKPNYHNISIRGREKFDGYIKFNVSNLYSDTKYVVRVAAGNAFVLSEYSSGRKFKTKFGKPPVKVVCSSANKLRFNLTFLIFFIAFSW